MSLQFHKAPSTSIDHNPVFSGGRTAGEKKGGGYPSIIIHFFFKFVLLSLGIYARCWARPAVCHCHQTIQPTALPSWQSLSSLISPDPPVNSLSKLGVRS